MLMILIHFASDDDYQAAIDEANQFNFINRTEGQWTNRYFGYVSDGLSAIKILLIKTKWQYVFTAWRYHL